VHGAVYIRQADCDRTVRAWHEGLPCAWHGGDIGTHSTARRHYVRQGGTAPRAVHVTPILVYLHGVIRRTGGRRNGRHKTITDRALRSAENITVGRRTAARAPAMRPGIPGVGGGRYTGN